ncbi:unnamed protein product [Enterobius vermicularis]|uniref:Shootin-1 n=1 Tax=Enterobius vermicularis TaxID=51028 RepID=A0A0N4VKT6_ENTVE|nr:unnamed protein product [Enterobius vermicularis]
MEELKKSYAEATEKLQSLEDIHNQYSFSSSLRRAEEAEKSAEMAKSNMEQAEVEAAECRKQAERMLEVTKQLTERNSSLSSECEILKEKLRQEVLKVLCFAFASFIISNLLFSYSHFIFYFSVESLLQKLEEANNEKEVIKKKNASFIKVVTFFVNSYGDSGDRFRSSSRASSVSSVDLNSKVTTGSPPPTVEQGTNGIQVQMVEKIVKLQKMLARKQEKIEFLEEHVQQCTHELCKKTKIIQNYALREEAALLMPADDGLSKVPLNRRTGGASLMGSMFSSGDKKTELELATEVNSRLQAVLEDTLYKNITLKTNLDMLGEEIARLSRENRQLSLQKTYDS